jgi:hypothetical protein
MDRGGVPPGFARQFLGQMNFAAVLECPDFPPPPSYGRGPVLTAEHFCDASGLTCLSIHL